MKFKVKVLVNANIWLTRLTCPVQQRPLAVLTNRMLAAAVLVVDVVGLRAVAAPRTEGRTVVSATLRVTHELSFGIELRRGRFEILVDGKAVGSVENRETLETPLEPGRHTVRIRKGRYSSREHSLEVADGESVSFQCHGIRIWPMYVASIVKPDLAISLKRHVS